MEKKIAYKIVLLVFYIFLFCPITKGQNKKDTINIIFKENLEHYAKVAKGDKISFFINKETFVFNTKHSKVQVFKEKDVRKDALFNIEEVLKRVHKRTLAEKDTDGTIHVLKKSEYFDVIYLYEFKECLVYRYPVKWEDSISDWEF